jgi:hypothetical protein
MKNSAGGFCVPEYGFCSIDSLRAGQGYKIWADASCDLVYCTACGAGAELAETYVTPSMQANSRPSHFRPVERTSDSYSILIDHQLLDQAGMCALVRRSGWVKSTWA